MFTENNYIFQKLDYGIIPIIQLAMPYEHIMLYVGNNLIHDFMAVTFSVNSVIFRKNS